MKETDYSLLFREARLPKLQLPNRLVMAPMTTTSGEPDGSFSKQEIKYLGQRAEDGIGMIMSPACYCHKSGHAFLNQVGCHNDDMLGGLTACAEAINKHGSVSVLQIHHGGNAASEKFTGTAPLAPSALKSRRGKGELPKEMTENEIEEIIESFALAGGRAKKAGFTAVEIHGANTYLFQQFFSPFTNRRTDRWGGDVTTPGHNRLENRGRFAVEVIKAVRAEVGDDYPIIYRISPEEPQPLGYSTMDAIGLLKMIVPYGVDMIHVSSWEYGQGMRADVPKGTHPTYMIKGAFPWLPVIGVGGIMTPVQAMKVMDDGIELVGLGRVLILEKDWVKKVKNGEADKIRTKLTTEAERETLDIPDKMKEYSKHFFKIDK